jgi:hypothetical protein
MDAVVNRRGRSPGTEFSIDFEEDGLAMEAEASDDGRLTPAEQGV